MKIREPINSITHLIGVILSIVGGILLFVSSIINLSVANILSSLVFTLGLVGLYTASTVYHWSTGDEDRLEKLRKIDHIMMRVVFRKIPINVLSRISTTRSDSSLL